MPRLSAAGWVKIAHLLVLLAGRPARKKRRLRALRVASSVSTDERTSGSTDQQISGPKDQQISQRISESTNQPTDRWIRRPAAIGRFPGRRRILARSGRRTGFVGKAGCRFSWRPQHFRKVEKEREKEERKREKEKGKRQERKQK